MLVFFFQAEDGIRDAQESRGLGDVYKRQGLVFVGPRPETMELLGDKVAARRVAGELSIPVVAGSATTLDDAGVLDLSLIHI